MTDGVLAQLSNRIEHGLRAYTPKEQKSVRAAADSFRENPEFDVYDTILNLGTGEAVISFLEEDGIPSAAEKVKILPPRCSFDAISAEKRDSIIKVPFYIVNMQMPLTLSQLMNFSKGREKLIWQELKRKNWIKKKLKQIRRAKKPERGRQARLATQSQVQSEERLEEP